MNDQDKAKVITSCLVLVIFLLFYAISSVTMTPEQKTKFWHDFAESMAEYDED